MAETEKGGEVTATDGGGRRDTETGDGGSSTPGLITPAALALGSDG
jgi:hypothetical protein